MGNGGASCNRILSRLTRYPLAEGRIADCRILREQGKGRYRRRLVGISFMFTSSKFDFVPTCRQHNLILEGIAEDDCTSKVD
jgi:hypothetical protein